MLSDDELADLPDDPELAFVQYESRLRKELYASLEASEGYSSESLQLEYMNHVLAAAKALNLDILQSWKLPSVDGRIDYEYRQFLSDVDHYTVQIRIRNARRTKRYSVALDAAAKTKIRHYLTKIKETVDRLEVSTSKREALYSKIAALESEVNRTRTRFDAVMDLILETAETGGEAVGRLEPVRRLIDSVAGLLKVAKDKEEKASSSLPALSERKSIEGPWRQLAPPEAKEQTHGLDDDEIPF